MQSSHNRPLAHMSDDEDVQHFTLTGLLPAPAITLALYLPLGTASLLTGPSGLLGQEQFTNNELLLLVPLLANYPYHCPYEVLYASFTYGRMSDTSVARARKVLHDAKNTNVWDIEMRPLRNVLSRVRLKSRRLGIEIISMIEVGYVLFPYVAKESIQEEPS